MSACVLLALVLSAAGPAAGDWQILGSPVATAAPATDWKILESAPTAAAAGGDWAILTQGPRCLCGEACTCEKCIGDCAPGYTRATVAAAIAANRPLVVAVDVAAEQLGQARQAAAAAGKLFCTASANQGFARGLHELTPRDGELWIDADAPPAPARTWRVYTRPSCAPCKAAIGYLRAAGQNVETISAGADDGPVPRIEVGAEKIIGFDRRKIDEVLASR